MANTGSMDVDAQSVYQNSFGGMRDKTVYQSADVQGLFAGKANEVAAVDHRPILRAKFEEDRQALLRAQTSTSGGSGTAGYAMIPIYVDPKIVDVTRKRTPLVELIPRVSNMGTTADYNKITAKGGAFTAAEDAALAERNTTYARASTTIKWLYSVGRVTGQSQVAQPAYSLMGFQTSGASGPFSDVSAPNSMQQETIVKARELRELEENLIVNGNASTSAISGNPNGTEFSGIVTLMGATNTVDKNTTALDLNDINTAA